MPGFNVPAPGLFRSNLLHRVLPGNEDRFCAGEASYGMAECGAACLPSSSLAGSQWCPACWTEGTMTGVAVTARRLIIGLKTLRCDAGGAVMLPLQREDEDVTAPQHKYSL